VSKVEARRVTGRRAADIVVALPGGLPLAPLLVAVAAAVWITTGRPVLFRQPRGGRHGEVLRVWKFRTMRPPAFPGQCDAARTDRCGRLLRSTSLDELPQLWNMLRGRMSLIGPRPTLPEQVARYSAHELRRLSIRPGLTGWAQVNGRNAISWPERIALDLWYIDNRSRGST